jgi:hypothetical protein
MHAKRWLQPLVLVLIVAVMGNGCLLIPKVQKKTIELAAGGSTTIEFPVLGTIQSGTLDQTVNLAGLDLATVLSDAGIDGSNVKDIKLAGVEYRVSVADPEPDREITINDITIQVGAGAEKKLVATPFTDAASSVYDFKLAPIDVASSAAVLEINGLLTNLLDNLKDGTALPTSLSCTMSAASIPADASMNFTLELRLKVSVVGTMEVTVVE